MKKILPIGLMLILAGAGCFSPKPPENSGNNTTSTPNTEVTTSIPITTTIEKTVTSTTKSPADPVAFGFTRLKDNKLKFQIDYPSRWKEGQSPQNGVDLFYTQLNTRTSEGSILGMVVVRVAGEKGITQSSFNTKLQNNVNSFGPKNEGEDYNLSFIDFAGQKNVAKFVSTNTKEYPYYAESYVIVRNELMYVISYQATDDKYKLDLPLLNRMIGSFKLL